MRCRDIPPSFHSVFFSSSVSGGSQRSREAEEESEIKRKRDVTGALVALPSPLVPVDFPITH